MYSDRVTDGLLHNFDSFVLANIIKLAEQFGSRKISMSRIAPFDLLI